MNEKKVGRVWLVGAGPGDVGALPETYFTA